MELTDLPADALTHIMLYLEYRDVLQMGGTCHALRKFCCSEVVWMNLCKPWKNDVSLLDWRRKANSYKSVFRLLNSLNSLVGSWGAVQLDPRGALVYVCWEFFSVVAFRVMAPWQDQQLVSVKMFEVIGEPDGTTRVVLMTREGLPDKITLPGALLWNTHQKDEFFLETVSTAGGRDEPQAKDSREASEVGILSRAAQQHAAEQARQRQRRDTLQQQFLMRHMWLGPDQQPQGRLLPGDPLEQEPPEDHAPAQNQRRHIHDLRRGAIYYIFCLARQAAILTRPAHSGHVEEPTASTPSEPYPGSVGLGFLGLHAPGGQLGTAEYPGGGVMSRIQVPASLYRKLEVQTPGPGQELAGLWWGMYGPHGAEILNVQYTQDDQIVAYKVLGDPNVPCREISFKVDLSSNLNDNLPEMLHLTALAINVIQPQGGNESPEPTFTRIYTGQGRVAGYNFRHPQWVPGLLLVETDGRIAFLWEDVHFIIRFSRLDLPMPLHDPAPVRAPIR